MSLSLSLRRSLLAHALPLTGPHLVSSASQLLQSSSQGPSLERMASADSSNATTTPHAGQHGPSRCTAASPPTSRSPRPHGCVSPSAAADLLNPPCYAEQLPSARASTVSSMSPLPAVFTTTEQPRPATAQPPASDSSLHPRPASGEHSLALPPTTDGEPAESRSLSSAAPTPTTRYNDSDSDSTPAASSLTQPLSSEPLPSPPGGTCQPSTSRHPAWAWFTQTLQAPRYVAAPMVLHTDAAFRILLRRRGAQLAYSPMLHADRISRPAERMHPDDAGELANLAAARQGGQDRPLLVQLCATDPMSFATAAVRIAPYADAVDLNLGCPQRTARARGFGAFLMDDPERVRALVQAGVAAAWPVPVTAKIRLLPTRAATVAFCRMLQDAGCSLVAVHGRQREQRTHTGTVDVAALRAVVEALDVPVLVNGGVASRAEADALMAATGAAGVLVGTALLADPRCLETEWGSDGRVSRPVLPLSQDAQAACALYAEYLALTRIYPPAGYRYLRNRAAAFLGPAVFGPHGDLAHMMTAHAGVRTRKQLVLLLGTLCHRLGLQLPDGWVELLEQTNGNEASAAVSRRECGSREPAPHQVSLRDIVRLGSCAPRVGAVMY